jgi:hypothetical protein
MNDDNVPNNIQRKRFCLEMGMSDFLDQLPDFVSKIAPLGQLFAAGLPTYEPPGPRPQHIVLIKRRPSPRQDPDLKPDTLIVLDVHFEGFNRSTIEYHFTPAHKNDRECERIVRRIESLFRASQDDPDTKYERDFLIPDEINDVTPFGTLLATKPVVEAPENNVETLVESMQKNKGGHPPIAANDWAYAEWKKRPDESDKIFREWKRRYETEVDPDLRGDVWKYRRPRDTFRAAMNHRRRRDNDPAPRTAQ